MLIEFKINLLKKVVNKFPKKKNSNRYTLLLRSIFSLTSLVLNNIFSHFFRVALNAILSVSPVAALSAILVGECRRDLSVGGFEDLIELCLCFLQYENPKRRLSGCCWVWRGLELNVPLCQSCLFMILLPLMGAHKIFKWLLLIYIYVGYLGVKLWGRLHSWRRRPTNSRTKGGCKWFIIHFRAV